MNAALLDHAAWLPGALDGLGDDVRAGRSRLRDGEGIAPDPICPEAFPAGQWRRMSRLSRGAAQCVSALVARHPGVAWSEAPMVWGTALGEVGASSTFLDRLHAEGPDRVSPLVFQGSVYNAALGRLSLALGLRGPCETVAAGQGSAVAALARGVAWLERAEHVLVVAGDERVEAVRRATSRLGVPPGEGAVALLLGRGRGLTIRDGVSGPRPWVGRRCRLPYEDASLPDVDLCAEDVLGLSCVGPLLVLIGLGRGTAVVADGDGAMSASLDPR